MDLNPKLIVPIYSMRSYKTGDYSILKDGNFKLQLNRMDWDQDILIIPKKEIKTINDI